MERSRNVPSLFGVANPGCLHRGFLGRGPLCDNRHVKEADLRRFDNTGQQVSNTRHAGCGERSLWHVDWSLSMGILDALRSSAKSASGKP
jgi:hypothetical protein